MKNSARPLGVVFLVLLLVLTFCLCGAGLCLCARVGPFADDKTAALRESAASGAEKDVTVDGDGQTPLGVVVLDPGHGGEDGGAQSAAGLLEKDVNLSVALSIRDLLEAAGVPVVMTRTDDRLLYDPTADVRGRKKAMDLSGRLRVAQSVPDSLFVSVHMNFFPQTQYSGMQVWFSPADARSEATAASIRAAGQVLDPLNRRRCKAAGSEIFLLDRLKTPAVLVEGGFLSNPAEAARLASDAYRQELALTVFAGVMKSPAEPAP